MTPTRFDVLVLAGALGWPAHMLSDRMINPNATSWGSRVASAFPLELEQLRVKLTAMAAERDRIDAAIAETDRRMEAMRNIRRGPATKETLPMIDPDYFAQRELAVTRAIQLNRDSWASPEARSLFDCPAVPSPPDELRAVRQAHTRALALGLVLPPFPATTVRFVRASAEQRAGGSTRQRGDVIEMVFAAGQPLEYLRRLALHELMHVHQHATGAMLSLEESEAEAEMFAWNALQGWAV